MLHWRICSDDSKHIACDSLCGIKWIFNGKAPISPVNLHQQAIFHVNFYNN